MSRRLLSLVLVGLCGAFPTVPSIRARITASSRPSCSTSPLHLTVQSDGDNSKTLTEKQYDTIQAGRIAVVPNFLQPQEINYLRDDAQQLYASHQFSTDALASYGTSGKFDPSKDRAVLRLQQWKDESIGTWETRRRFGNRMAALRSDLAYNLNRPHLDEGVAISKYGSGSTEISYTRFGPGAFLRRHVDEHHEELKGTDGWSKPTRRSISWLIYLNEEWNGKRDGGQLRCFERSDLPSQTVGARPNGDLQIGWLRASAIDPVERPVFLDGRRADRKCAMYFCNNDDATITYITKEFDSHPILYVAGGETLAKRLLVDRSDLAARFHFIEPPKSKIGDMMGGKQDYVGLGEDPASDELLADIDPMGGTLVLFDSVSLPHEVLATKNRERWATSGWFHEDQQPEHGHREIIS